jgi:hypothetical protein
VTPHSPENPKSQQQEAPVVRKPWVEPEVRQLDVQETAALPGTGQDIGGNAAPDCQRS